MGSESRQRLRWLAALAVAAALYAGFRGVRPQLPPGFLKDSFPSMLVIVVMLGCTRLFTSIRFHSLGRMAAITFASTCVAALWFEVAVPLFHARSRGDWMDVAGMFVGWAVFCGLYVVDMRTR